MRRRRRKTGNVIRGRGRDDWWFGMILGLNLVILGFLAYHLWIG
jgi:hypothetical protein